MPRFYPKLYALLTPAVFVSKRRAEFFELSDLFLSSEYLPLSTAAAFAKRLARLALVAPAAGAVVCLQLVFNILRRHPNTLFLIHKQEQQQQQQGQQKQQGEPAPKKWRRAEAIDRRELNKSDAANDDDGGDDFVPEAGRAAPEDDLALGAAVAELPVFAEEPEEPPARPAHPGNVVAAPLLDDPFDAETNEPDESHAMESQVRRSVCFFFPLFF